MREMLDSKNSQTNASDATQATIANSTTRHFVGALNTRRIGNKYRIRLTKSKDGGFGIKIAERDNMFGTNRPIYITAITTTGSAYRDGRLREGDMLLEVDGHDLSGKSQPEITRMLKAVPVDSFVEFVVSRQEDNDKNSKVNDYQNIDNFSTNNNLKTDNNNTTQDATQQTGLFKSTTTFNKLPLTGSNELLKENGCDVPDQNIQFEKKIDSILDMPIIDGPGTYVYDVPLNGTKSAGLGLYLKYPRTVDRKDLGIWIENVITGGAAWKDGRVQPDDQILAINGIDLLGLSNTEATKILKAAVSRGIGPEATSNTIRLKIHRRDPLVVSRILHPFNNKSNSNSSNDITTSPKTQASLSIHNSVNNSSSNTSSAISQANNATNMPTWEDDSSDGETRFVRDGFGRQSISEKRHAQLMAKNTDTFKKIQEKQHREQQLHDEQKLQIEKEQLQQQQEQLLQQQLQQQQLQQHLHHQQIIQQQQLQQQHHHQQQQQLFHQQQQLIKTQPNHYGSVRVARSESFRAAVDRSYDNNELITMNKSQVTNNNSNKQVISNSKSNTTSNGRANNCSNSKQVNTSKSTSGGTHKKSSSLLTKFLKFGSMRKDKKAHNNDKTKDDESTKDSHSSNHSVNQIQYQQPQQHQLYSHNTLQAQPHNNIHSYNTLGSHNNYETSAPHLEHTLQRASMHMYRPQPMYNNHHPIYPNQTLNGRNHIYSMTQPKLVPNVITIHNNNHAPIAPYQQSQQWHSPPVHAPNGLWVANPPNQVPHNIYKTHNQYQQPQHIYYYDF